MWIRGNVELKTAKSFVFNGFSKASAGTKPRMAWNSVTSTTTLQTDVFRFTYATARTSFVGKRVGLRHSMSGIALSSALRPYLVRSGADLRLHSTFSDAKDFVSTGYTGTFGAAITYLKMISLGYPWAAHWEDLVPTSTGARPDFVFADNGRVCITDAKGSSGNEKTVDGAVKTSWREQIYDNRSVKIGPYGNPTEGRVFAGWLSTVDPGTIVEAYGSFSPTSTSILNIAAANQVKRANIRTVAHLIGLGQRASTAAITNMEDLLRRRPQRPKRLLSFKDHSVLIGPPIAIVPHNGRFYHMSVFMIEEIAHYVRRYMKSGIPDVEPGSPNAEILEFETNLPLESGLELRGDKHGYELLGPDGAGAIFKLIA